MMMQEMQERENGNEAVYDDDSTGVGCSVAIVRDHPSR
jgi:hypothetical protein